MRITPEEVLEAYEETGLEVNHGRCYQLDNARVIRRACAMGAVVYKELLEEKQGRAFHLHYLFKAMEELYPSKYRMGFQKGFDLFLSSNTNEEFREGYEDGRNAHFHIKEKLSSQTLD